GQKNTVPLRTKGRLDAALQQAEDAEKERWGNEKPPRQPLPEGFYESVFNATWSHVMGFPEGEGEDMVVIEGQRPQELWEYTQTVCTFLPVGGEEQFHPPRPRLMILSSEQRWPYSLEHAVPITDCYINIEVHRVWKIVEGDLKGVFPPPERGPPYMRRRLLVGTPGIGKSMAAGSYLLYQLLHYDATTLHVVVYCFGRDFAYLFDRRARTVTEYEGERNIRRAMINLARTGMKGYIIIDMARQLQEPSNDFVPSPEWGIIMLSSPNEDNFKAWAKQVGAIEIIMNCPDENDVKAMCAWGTRNTTEEEQAEYWRSMYMRMHDVGPIPRCIFNDNKYRKRVRDANNVLEGIDASNAKHYKRVGGKEMCPSNDASHKLVKVVRLITQGDVEEFVNMPACFSIGSELIAKLLEVDEKNDIFFRLSKNYKVLFPELLEQHTLHAFLSRVFVENMMLCLKELPPPGPRQRQRCVLQSNPEKHPSRPVALIALGHTPPRLDAQYEVLYLPNSRNFPLVDGFFFVGAPRRTMVGVQVTTRAEHDTRASTVRRFNNLLRNYFNDWETFAEGLSWEIIYVQHEGSTVINAWQKCVVVAHANVTGSNEPEDPQAIAAFWNQQVRQYQVTLSYENFIHERQTQRGRHPEGQGKGGGE
ncbi:retrotransposon hot spot (RHS) protein, partial [Trypanosoma rangeli]